MNDLKFQVAILGDGHREMDAARKICPSPGFQRTRSGGGRLRSSAGLKPASILPRACLSSVVAGIIGLNLAGALPRAMAVEKTPSLKTAKVRPVHFGRDVKPILALNCFKCHALGREKGEFNMDSREAFLKGGESGNPVKPGHPDESLLIQLVSGNDAEKRMPPRKESSEPLSAAKIAVLRNWIDQGLDWSEDKSANPYQLALRPVNVPPGDGHPIDRLLASYFERHNVTPARPVTDGLFARRVFLDLIGVLPTRAELQAFDADTRHDKRERLVRSLLGEHETFVGHWMSFWMDHLRIGSALDAAVFDNDKSVKPRQWLEAKLRAGDTFDGFVRDIFTGEFLDVYGDSVAPQGEVANAQGRPEMQSAQILSQAFLGVRLQCASCHDSFVDSWTLSEAWGLASALGPDSLEMARCEVPTGERAAPRFLFPELGGIEESLSVAGRRQRVAELMTSTRNGLFARTIVNRLWARLFGRGLIEPVDEMIEQEPWNAEVLDWLAGELIRQKFDLKKLIETIVSSRVYQLPAGNPKMLKPELGAAERDVATASRPSHSNDASAFVFTGPLFRRLTAEQVVDALYLVGSPSTNHPVRPARRAWQQVNDPLMRALGRPDRNVIVTTRSSDPNPLQSLELMNGERLEELVMNAARQLIRQAGNSDRALIESAYLQLLARQPSAAELARVRETHGQLRDEDSVADLLWALLMLPEFQFIR